MEGLSRSAIARRLGVSRSTIAIVMRIWRISRPSPRRVPCRREAGSSRTPGSWIHGRAPIGRCHANSGIPPDGCSIVWLPSRGSLARIRRCSAGSNTGGRSIAPSRTDSRNWRGRPGIGQVDFGQARASIAGVERDVHVLVVSFPFSNMRFAVALPGENAPARVLGVGRDVRADRPGASDPGVR